MNPPIQPLNDYPIVNGHVIGLYDPIMKSREHRSTRLHPCYAIFKIETRHQGWEYIPFLFTDMQRISVEDLPLTNKGRILAREKHNTAYGVLVLEVYDPNNPKGLPVAIVPEEIFYLRVHLGVVANPLRDHFYNEPAPDAYTIDTKEAPLTYWKATHNRTGEDFYTPVDLMKESLDKHVRAVPNTFVASDSLVLSAAEAFHGAYFDRFANTPNTTPISYNSVSIRLLNLPRDNDSHEVHPRFRSKYLLQSGAVVNREVGMGYRDRGIGLNYNLTPLLWFDPGYFFNHYLKLI